MSVKTDPILHATGIQLKTDTNAIEVTWQNGERIEIPWQTLRQYCACAQCRSKQHLGSQLISDVTEVVNLSLMGNTGLQITFADGHDRGIFPWAYLQAISLGQAKDFLNE